MSTLLQSPIGTEFVWANPLLTRLLLASIEFAALALVIGVVVKLWGGKRPRVAVYLWAIVLVKPLISLIAGTPLPIVSFAAPGTEEQVAVPPSRGLEAPLENGKTRAAELAAPAEAGASREIVRLSELPVSAPEVESRSMASHEALRIRTGQAATAGGEAEEPYYRLDWITGLWLIGCAGVAAWLVRSRCAAARLAARGRPASGALAASYQALSRELGIKEPPSLRVRDDLPSPALVGVIRPTILIPAWLADDKPLHGSDVLRWSLRHELTHYRSGDPVLILLRDLVRGVFFFHPAAWWCGARLEEAIEVACDHSMVADRRQAMAYAKGLYELLNRDLPQTAPVASGGLSATRTQIGRRIASLLQGPLSFGGRLGKFTMAAVALFAAAIFCIGVGTHSTLRADAEDAESAAAAAGERTIEEATSRDRADTPRTGEEKLVLLEGKVLLPDGRPAAAADVIFTHAIADYTERFRETNWPHAVANDRGEFRLQVDTSRINATDWSPEAPIAWLYAVAEGTGFALLEMKSLEEGTKDLTLKLVRAQPIEGRILDLEGQPVQEAKIHVNMVAWFADKGLDRMVDHIRTIGYEASLDVATRVPPNLPETVIADADGRFRLAGLGEERFVRLEISGPGIHHDKIGVLTRQMPDERVPSPTERGPAYGKDAYYWSSFRHLSDAGRTIEGVVRDAVSGAPVEGTTVECYLTHDSSTVTDGAGRFALHGVRKSDRYRLDIKPPTDGRYLARDVRIPDEPGLQPQQVEIEMKRGIAIHGRFEAIGVEGPKRGRIEYFPIYPNENVIKYGVNTTPGNEVEVRADGTFSIAVVPGPGALAFRPDRADQDKYQTAYASPDDVRKLFGDAALTDRNEYTEDHFPVAVATDAGNLARGAMGQEHYAAIELINPTEEQQTLSVELEASPGRTVYGKVVDQDGKPVTDVWVGGTNHRFMARRQESAEFEVVGWNPARTRHLFFYQPERKLGAVLDLTAQTETPLTITLQPFGTVSGRLIDPEGEPLVNLPINLTQSGHVTGLNEDTQKTDAEGRFRFEDVIPGEEYWISLVGVSAVVEDDISVEPGEDKDLGDVDVRSGTMEMMKELGM